MKNLVLLLAFILCGHWVLAQSEPFVPVRDSTTTEEVYLKVDKMPEYIGGEKAYMKVLLSIVYPYAAKKNDISGKVIVSYIVDTLGNVGDIKVVKGLGYGTEESTIDVVKKLKKFKPGKLNGRPVRVKKEVVQNFTLN